MILLTSRHTNHLSRKDRPNTLPPTTSEARRYHNCYTWNKRTTHTKIRIIPNKTGERRLQGQQKAIKILPEGNSIAGTHHFTNLNQTKQKTDAIDKLNPPTDTKTLKSFLGAIQYFAKFIPNFSEKTDNMRQLLRK